MKFYYYIINIIIGVDGAMDVMTMIYYIVLLILILHLLFHAGVIAYWLRFFFELLEQPHYRFEIAKN